MEQLNPQPYPQRPMNLPPGMGGPNPGMMNPPFPPNNFPNLRPAGSNYPNEQEQKKKQFAKGIFISGFEKCVTTAMIQRHFSIKTIYGLKHPMTKFKESKGFAFIYYGSEDDALYVKKTLDRTAILREKVRITRTVISQNLSKMMVKLKTFGFSEKEMQENETKYFNDQKLENEVERIIKPLFGATVEVNKINIPRSKSDKKPLRYARVFFYVSDVKEAKNIAEKTIKANDITYDTTGKNEYEIILNCISHKINNDDIFGHYAKSEIYEYTKKNQSNVLHLKGVKNNANEDPAVLAEEIKEFVQKQGPQWNIVNAYASVYESRGAWANITFSTYEETIQAYETLKTLRPKFRDSILYGSLRNVKDPRTVVISVVKKDVTEKDVERFLNELATKSVKITNGLNEEDVFRKYDYFSFNIIESKKFYKVDGDETKSVLESELETIHPSWIEINEVPRRLIIHFFHEFNEEDIKELTNDITVSPEYENIFLKGDKNRQLRSNHQKGHVSKEGVYIKHTEMKGKKKVRAPRAEKPMRRPMDPNARMQNRGGPNVSKPVDFSTGGLSFNRQPPKTSGNMQGNQGYRPPGVGAAGGLGYVPPPINNNPNMRPPFNPPQSYMGGSMPYKPQPNMPPSNMPPSNMPPSNMPPSNMPQYNKPPNMAPMPPPGFRTGGPSYNNPMSMPPTGNPQNVPGGMNQGPKPPQMYQGAPMSGTVPPNFPPGNMYKPPQAPQQQPPRTE